MKKFLLPNWPPMFDINVNNGVASDVDTVMSSKEEKYTSITVKSVTVSIASEDR